nr:IMP dehydrogenase [Roseburia sp. AM59-24XD]
MGKIIAEGITFDDVLLVPQYSEVIPNQVSLETHLTKSIKLNIPMMSAGMDTVTENRMAIAWRDRVESVLFIRICRSKHRQMRLIRLSVQRME